jgi:hypothetical protein
VDVDASPGVVARGVDLEALGGGRQEALGGRAPGVGDPHLAALVDQLRQQGQQRLDVAGLLEQV